MASGTFVNVKMDGGVEQVSPVNVNIPANQPSGEITLSPKHMTTPINAIRFIITVNVVDGATALSGGTVGDFINELKIMQGSKTLIKFNSIADIQAFYHIKTGQTLSDVALPTTASTTDTATLEFVLPFGVTLGQQVVVKGIFNGYANSVSGGSVSSANGSIGVAFYYQKEPMAVSEEWDIIQTATTINANTDANLGNDLPSKPIYDLWTNVGADANLNYYKYELNKSELYNSYPYDLIQYEVKEPQYSHVSGLFRLPINSGVLINTASNIQPQAIINLSTAEQVKIYARVG
jgi:hypothetical protein